MAIVENGLTQRTQRTPRKETTQTFATGCWRRVARPPHSPHALRVFLGCSDGAFLAQSPFRVSMALPTAPHPPSASRRPLWLGLGVLGWVAILAVGFKVLSGYELSPGAQGAAAAAWPGA